MTKNKPSDKRRYRTFILRSWQENRVDHPPIWRFSLEMIGSKERYGFTDLNDVLAFLQNTINEQ
ncbi:MAG: hypothetical protein QNJ45_04665 [Ardenticatenaceae bacterium]|nr:hypothetical protein [Ardenticatenaceae bacterium]